MGQATIGDPFLEETDIGPLISDDSRSKLHQQVVKTIDHGARCLLGGEMPSGKGFYYPSTVLTAVTEGSPAYEEELFGPVAAIISVSDENEAVRVANGSSFGLGAAVFTKDARRGEAIARKLEVGSCSVNDMVRSDPRLPFGGIKNSGYGRELSEYGIHEFVNIKTISTA
jgi:succinate-semialdehyde dehydrogenase/glutarate-semialdehyde dehydrogenase